MSELQDFYIKNGVLVKYIGRDQKVDIPFGITAIGEDAFFDIAEYDSYMGSFFYDDCDYKSNKNHDDYCQDLEDEESFAISEVDIPNTVTRIGNNAFGFCRNLKVVNIPASVTDIGEDVFEGCCDLENINVDKNNPVYKSIDGNLYNKKGTILFAYAFGKKDIVFKMPIEVMRVEKNAFSSCVYLKNIVISPNTRMIRKAFEFCSSIETVTISSSVNSIGEAAFSKCYYLEEVNILNGVGSIGYEAFLDCVSLKKINIPASVKIIGIGAFLNCKCLENVSLNVGIDTIANKAFFDCIKLKTINIPDGLRSIGDEAFCNCQSLTSIHIPRSVTSIGEKAFYGCTGIKQITVDEHNTNYKTINGNLYSKDERTLVFYTNSESENIPDILPSVTKICAGAFSACPRLRRIFIHESVKDVGDDLFHRDCVKTQIYAPTDTYLGKYTKNNNYSYVESNLSNNCIAQNNGALLKYLGNDYEVTIPDTVTRIENRAFENRNINIVKIPSSVTYIGEMAFANCKELLEVNIPDDVNVINNGTFFRCQNLKEIILPECVTKIGVEAFNGCINLTSITMPNCLQVIDVVAFAKCQALTEIILPQTLTKIGERAFSNCYNLKTIKYKGTRVQWEAISKGDRWDYGLGHYDLLFEYKDNFEQIELDQTDYYLHIAPVTAPSLDVLRYISKLLKCNYIQTKARLVDEIIIKEKETKVSDIANKLISLNLAYTISPDYPYDITKGSR